MIIKKTLSGIVLAGILALSVCSGNEEPEVKEVNDSTGDNILDIILEAKNGNFLLIGKGDGSYTKVRLIRYRGRDYFKIGDDDGDVYSFDRDRRIFRKLREGE